MVPLAHVVDRQGLDGEARVVGADARDGDEALLLELLQRGSHGTARGVHRLRYAPFDERTPRRDRAAHDHVTQLQVSTSNGIASGHSRRLPVLGAFPTATGTARATFSSHILLTILIGRGQSKTQEAESAEAERGHARRITHADRIRRPKSLTHALLFRYTQRSSDRTQHSTRA